MVRLQNGYTLMHEHITIDLSSVKGDSDCRLDCFDETIKELKILNQLGVGNIVDVTNIGMGRNPDYVKRVEMLTGIQILQSTGFYKEPFLPALVQEKGTEELAQIMIDEIETGIDGKFCNAEMIGEIGTSKNKMEPMEKKVFEAAVLAAKKTGKPIYTHTTLGTYGLEQAEYLIEKGLNPGQLIIGHMDLPGNMDEVLKILRTGVSVGFDTVGKNNYLPDAERVKMILELERKNLLHQVVLSMDLTRKTHLSYLGGIGYGYLFQVFLPLLFEGGVTRKSVDRMLVENPKQLFGLSSFV